MVAGTAYSILPTRFEDRRHEKIKAGLRRLGYKIIQTPRAGPPHDERDLLVTWTVHRGSKEDQARVFERLGGRVIVCEESHLKGIVHRKMFSLSLHDHNGAGTWNPGGPERWRSFGIELKPWRRSGEYILVNGQRGIGSSQMASPPDWHNLVTKRIKSHLPIRVRPHPKSRSGPLPTRTLDEDLAGAFAVVIWSSGTGTKALIDGIPVYYDAPSCFVAGAAVKIAGQAEVDDPPYPDRLPAFERFAWSQWFADEIESGTAFERLLS